MIDKVAYPMPDPPDIDSNDTIKFQDVVDSLLKRKIKIAIFPRITILNSIPEMGELHKEYYTIPSLGHIVIYF
jgi:CRISPR/Cas system-associated protein Cas5 (RAMP superfamily)